MGLRIPVTASTGEIAEGVGPGLGLGKLRLAGRSHPQFLRNSFIFSE